eukprot:gene13687-17972_t
MASVGGLGSKMAHGRLVATLVVSITKALPEARELGCALTTGEIVQLCHRRVSARRAKDWARCDSILGDLRKHGVQVDDTARWWATPDGRTGPQIIGLGTNEKRNFRSMICEEFRRGHCPRGDLCTYAHGEAQLRRPIEDSRNVGYEKGELCKFMKEWGRCPRGDECPFAHTGEEGAAFGRRHRRRACFADSAGLRRTREPAARGPAV